MAPKAQLVDAQTTVSQTMPQSDALASHHITGPREYKRILSHRFDKDGNVLYLVEWKSTWEYGAVLGQIEQALNVYIDEKAMATSSDYSLPLTAEEYENIHAETLTQKPMDTREAQRGEVPLSIYDGKIRGTGPIRPKSKSRVAHGDSSSSGHEMESYIDWSSSDDNGEVEQRENAEGALYGADQAAPREGQ